MPYIITSTVNAVMFTDTVTLNRVIYQKNSVLLGLESDAISIRAEVNRGFLPDISIGALAEVVSISKNGLPLAVPGTMALLLEALRDLFFSPLQDPSGAPGSLIPVFILGGNAYVATLADNGRHFIWYLPVANKTFTIPPGLPVGWNCTLVKKFAGNSITITPGAGVTLEGADLIMNTQFSKVEIIVENTNIVGVYNLLG